MFFFRRKLSGKKIFCQKKQNFCEKREVASKKDKNICEKQKFCQKQNWSNKNFFVKKKTNKNFFVKKTKQKFGQTKTNILVKKETKFLAEKTKFLAKCHSIKVNYYQLPYLPIIQFRMGKSSVWYNCAYFIGCFGHGFLFYWSPNLGILRSKPST